MHGPDFLSYRKIRHLRSEKHEVFFIGLRFSASPFLYHNNLKKQQGTKALK